MLLRRPILIGYLSPALHCAGVPQAYEGRLEAPGLEVHHDARTTYASTQRLRQPLQRTSVNEGGGVTGGGLPGFGTDQVPVPVTRASLR